jgi:microcystin-dependent protein
MPAGFPFAIDETTIADTTSIRQIGAAVRLVKNQYDAIFGFPVAPTNLTAAAASMAAGGLMTWLQNIQWQAGGANLGILAHANTVTRTYTFPDASGAVALATDFAGTPLTNRTGGTLAAGNVVGFDPANDTSVILADASGIVLPLTVAQGTVPNLSTGLFLGGTKVSLITTQGVVVRGNWLRKSATTLAAEDTGVAQTVSPPAGTFALALTGSGGGASAVVGELLGSTVGSTIPVGMLGYFSAAAAPAGWLLCDGSAVSRTTFAALFAYQGIVWGAGNGTTTFNVPDIRGRTLIGAGTGAGLSNRQVAGLMGEENHLLTVAELAAHSHVSPDGFGFVTTGGLSVNLAGGVATAQSYSGNTTQSAGGNGAHNTMQPSAVGTCCVKT